MWEEWDESENAVSRSAHKTNSVVVVTIVDTDDEDASSRTASCSPREQQQRAAPEHSISEVTVISVHTTPAAPAHDDGNMVLHQNGDAGSPQDNYNHAQSHEELQTNPLIYKINHPLGVKNYVIKLKDRATRERIFKENNVERVTVNTSPSVCSYDGVRNLLTNYGVISPIDYSRRGSGDELASKEEGGDQMVIDDVSDDVEMEEEEEPAFETQEISFHAEACETSLACTDPEMEDCNSSVVRTEYSPNCQQREELTEKDAEPLKRRSKRINRLNGEKKQKCSETGLGRTRAKQLTKKACTNPLAGARRSAEAAGAGSKAAGAGAGACEKRAGGGAGAAAGARGRGGVATRARARHLLSVGAVWRRPTAADLGHRRSWPVAGMHERPVWPPAPPAPPPPPPAPPRAPSPDPADLARQRDIEIRLHWALAACFQVYKDSNEVRRSRSKQTSQIRTDAWPFPAANKSVQDIYIESRLYKFFDNEMSKIFLKNGTSRYSNSKFRECMAALRSNHTSEASLISYFYPQGSLIESLQKCLQKEQEIVTFTSEEQKNDFTPKNANNICKFSKSKIFSGEVHDLPSECDSSTLQHSSSLNERKCEVLEKLSKFIEDNCMDLNARNSFSTHGTLGTDHNQEKFDETSINQWDRSNSNLYGETAKNHLIGLDNLDNKDKECIPDTPNLVYFKSNTLNRTCAIDSRTILDSLCCVLYSIARDYCKINSLKTDELVNYIDSLTPQLLMEWIEKNIEYESERL